jgi:hypothetical protein
MEGHHQVKSGHTLILHGRRAVRIHDGQVVERLILAFWSCTKVERAKPRKMFSRSLPPAEKPDYD